MNAIDTTLDRTSEPTGEQWDAYSAEYDYFNAALFGGELPSCILNFNAQLRRAYGFFAQDRWQSGERRTHEISLNPRTLRGRKPIAISSTLVHEMAHLWQAVFGKPGRRGYHNKQWAAKMIAVGLMPSDTAEPGGKQTGQRVGHYVIEGGVFDVAFANMPENYLLPWLAGEAPKETKPRNDKTKFVCPDCEQNVWGIAATKVTCGFCSVEMIDATVELRSHVTYTTTVDGNTLGTRNPFTPEELARTKAIHKRKRARERLQQASEAAK